MIPWLRRKELFRSVFSGPDGEEVLRLICKEGYVFRTTYCPRDPVETAHREGMRRFALSIMRQAGIKDNEKQLELIMENFDE